MNYDYLRNEYPETVSMDQLYRICHISKRSDGVRRVLLGVEIQVGVDIGGGGEGGVAQPVLDLLHGNGQGGSPQKGEISGQFLLQG